MKTCLKRLVPVLCTGVFIVSGCAKQQTVKIDEPIALSATIQKAAPAQAEKPAATQQQAPASNGLATSSIQTAPAQPLPAQTAAAASGSLEKIYFDFDSDVLSDSARKTLVDNFEKLKAMQSAKVRIEGHCDERGSDDYNLALSERRAQAAVKYLSALGLPAARLSAIGFGEEKPADPKHAEEAWAKNRRDEFNISK